VHRRRAERNSYNRLAAARDPGIHKSTLFRKLIWRHTVPLRSKSAFFRLSGNAGG
jgi:hypothetical protein